MIVPVCCIENTALSLIFDPGPRFSMISFHTFHQNLDVIGELTMYIRFIPCGKRSKTLHHRMVGHGYLCCKGAGVVPHKLSPNHGNHFFGISKAIRSEEHTSELQAREKVESRF